MRKLTAIIALLCIVLSMHTGFAYGIIEQNDAQIVINYDDPIVGGNWSSAVSEPYNGSLQGKFYYNSDSDKSLSMYRYLGSAGIFTGSIVFEYDVTPLQESAGFTFRFRTFDGIETSNSKMGWGPFITDFKADGSLYADVSGEGNSAGTKVGYYVANETYKVRAELNFVDHVYKTYITGMLKEDKSGQAEYAENKLAGEFKLNEDAMGVGYMTFDLSTKKAATVYMDNFATYAGNIVYGLENDESFIKAGAKKVQLYMNQLIPSNLINKLVITKNGVDLKRNTDYKIKYNIEAETVEAVGGIVVNFTNEIAEGDILEFNLTAYKDMYTRSFSNAVINAVCVNEEDAVQIESDIANMGNYILSLNSGLDFENVTENILLPLQSESGMDIEWIASTDEKTVNTDGTVTRPVYNEETDTSKYVTLTYKISKGNMAKTAEITMKVLMGEPSEEYYALKEAVGVLDSSIPAESALLYKQDSFPVEIDISGKIISVEYKISGTGETTDEVANQVLSIDGGLSAPDGKLITSFDENSSVYNTPVEVTATLTLGRETPLVLKRNYSVARKHILTDAVADAADMLMFDADETTAWNPEGESAENEITFDKAYVIGDMKITAGSYDSADFYASLSGSEYKKIEKFPVEADKIKISASKSGGGISIATIEAMLSDEQLSEFDVQSIEIKDDLDMVEEDKITLPTLTRYGLEIVWQSDKTSVIDNYGTVFRPSEDTTVVMTAMAKDSDGNVIEKYKKEFIVTVKAEERSGGGGFGGGGGGGSSSKVNIGAYIPPSNTEELVYIEKPENTLSFDDITEHWAKKEIEYLAGRKIVNGKNEKMFVPDDSITREEFVKICVVAFELNANEEEPVVFEDVAEEAWYKEYIDTASALGIVSGKGTVFGAGEKITRQDMAVILDRIIEYKAMTPEKLNDKAEFADDDKIADYALQALTNMNMFGFINGYPDGTVCPMNNATRAETAAVIFKIVSKL